MKVWGLVYANHYYFTHPWVWLGDVLDNVRWAWQRVFKGYDERVAWSIDWHLVEVMPLWLDELIDGVKKMGGTPMDFVDLYDNEEQAETAWIETLEEIRNGFLAGADVLNLEWDNVEEYNELMKRAEHGLELFRKHFFSLWW